MTDEEKKALDKLSSKKNETTWDDTIRQIKREEIRDVVVTRQKYITAVLKLIEKQSKEIEELKNGQIDFWISDKEIEDRIKNKFTSNDKIKAKIEEYKEKYKNYNCVIAECLNEFYSLLEKE